MKQYKESTKHGYRQRMATFCNILDMNPDELALVNPEEAVQVQIKLAKAMEDNHLTDFTIRHRLSSLHSFWRANNVRVLTHQVMKYDGLPSLQRLVKAPKTANWDKRTVKAMNIGKRALERAGLS
jgi:hypothetical protein